MKRELCFQSVSYRGLLLALVALSLPLLAHAQTPTPTPDTEADFTVPARPTVSNPAEFQRPGVLQLEFGYNANFRTPNGPRAAQDAPLALRFAATRRLLFEVDLDNPVSQTLAGLRMTGAGDTQLGVQGVLQHETKTRPGVALAYYIKLPSASSAKGLGTGRVDHNFLALVSKQFGATTVDFNAIYLLAGRTTNTGHASSGQAALAASRNVTKRVGLQGELSGFSRNDAQPGALFGLGVATYQVNRRLVFDGGVRVGLSPAAPRVGVVAGLTVGVADLFRHRHS